MRARMAALLVGGAARLLAATGGAGGWATAALAGKDVDPPSNEV